MQKLSLVAPKVMEELRKKSQNPSELPTSSSSEECEICFGSEMEVTPSGARLCICGKRKRRLSLLSRIPEKFQHVQLERITPDPKRHPRQAEILTRLQADPAGSYFIAGRPGVGKTMFTWALYRHTVEAGDRTIVCCTLSDLLEEYRAVFRAMKANEQPDRPRLVAESLMQNQTKYAVFLDDIDKANVTEYVSEQVYRLINAIYEYGHQLVVTTNKNVSDLQKQYSRVDEARGGPTIRRILEGSTMIEMF